MTSSETDIRLLLELYADGEADAEDRAHVEALLAEDASARGYLEALAEARELIRLPIEQAAESVNFDRLSARIMAELDAPVAAAVPRTAENDQRAIAWADGEISDAAEAAQIAAYVEAHEDVRDAVETIRGIGDIVRAPVAAAEHATDFGALARRIDAAVDQVDAERAADAAAAQAPERVSLFAKLTGFLGAHRAVFASAVTAAAVALIMIPLVGDNGEGGPVINNFYYPAVDEVSFEKGFSGYSDPGNKSENLPPVVWFEASNGSGNADADAEAWRKLPLDLGDSEGSQTL